MAPLCLFVCLLGAPPVAIETRLEQLAPPPATMIENDTKPRRRPDMHRAVVLLHGLRPQPVSAAAASRAEPSYWEKPQAPIVKALTPDADVYAFHYAQIASVEDIAHLPALADATRSLRAAGYQEVILVGYSAGGLIARFFVEDTPNTGVTKVIQVCAPNTGSDWTVLKHGVREVQVPFVRSLTKEERLAASKARAGKSIPAQIEFACIVAAANPFSDGIVRRDAQWPIELQSQGIPAEVIYIQHVGAMYSNRLAARIAELVKTPQPRWSSERILAARPKVLGLMANFTPLPVNTDSKILPVGGTLPP